MSSPDTGAPETADSAFAEPTPVILPLEDVLDLHAFAPKEIPEVVAGFPEIRLIHGKGIGVQRERIRMLLQVHPLVEEFRDAPAERGHWGATIVRLRRSDH